MECTLLAERRLNFGRSSSLQRDKMQGHSIHICKAVSPWRTIYHSDLWKTVSPPQKGLCTAARNTHESLGLLKHPLDWALLLTCADEFTIRVEQELCFLWRSVMAWVSARIDASWESWQGKRN